MNSKYTKKSTNQGHNELKLNFKLSIIKDSQTMWQLTESDLIIVFMQYTTCIQYCGIYVSNKSYVQMIYIYVPVLFNCTVLLFGCTTFS